MDVFIYFTLAPFIFSVIFAFFLIYNTNLSIYILLIVSLFSFLAIFISSLLQLLTSFLLSQFLQQENTLTIFFNSFIYSGAIEEITKFLFFYVVISFVIPSHCKKLEENATYHFEKAKKQFLILVMFFASCFAGFENIAYMVFNIKILHIRLITATLFHIFVSPYYLKSIPKTNNIRPSFLIIPIFLHGTYNILITSGGIFSLLSFVIILFLVIRTSQIARFGLN